VRRSKLALALSVAACSSTSASPVSPPGDAGADAQATAPACTPTSACPVAPSAGARCVTTVDATLVDPSGHPLAGIPVFACGTNLCTAPQTTGEGGHARVAACLGIANAALKIFDDPARVPFAALLEGAGPGYVVPRLVVAPLPAAAGSPLAPGSNASAGVTLDVPGAVTFDLEHTTPASQAFRAAAVTPAWFAGTGLDPAATGVAVAWGLAPLDAKLAPPGKLTVPNAAGWAPGAAVDFFLDGADTTTATPFAPWGTWGPMGSGHVSADGKTVATDDGAGNGLPEVGLVGVRLHR
jgi:hypothetical protein